MRALTILTNSAFLLMITTTTSPRVSVALAGSDDDQHRRSSSILWRGSSMAVGDDALVSPNGASSCGFNRDAPVNGMGSRAELCGDDGSLVLQDFDGQAVCSTNTTGADRARICLDDCNCQALGYKKGGTGTCYPEIALWNRRGRRGPDTSTSVRIGSSSRYLRSSGGGEINFGYFYSFLAGLFVVEAIFILIGYLFIFVLADTAASRRVHDEEGYSLVPSNFRRFAYDELSRATWDFGEELGRAVYKGVLGDGRDVAVTRLAEAADEVFRSELSVIGRINHMNLVKIWGFCSEGSHRLLVCEYVENGSLAEALLGSENETPLAWHSRYKIAVGAAKGLAYLHHECLEWILHCDVKPENILLDAHLEPKITGFSLVKLLSGEEYGVATGDRVLSSRAQGANHMAPESALGQPVTTKADVYSFGVMLLELLSGQRVSEWLVMEGERTGYQRLVALLKDEMGSQYRTSVPAWLPEFVDTRLLGDFSHMQAAAMLDLAVTCVHDDPGKRPGMNAVVQNLISLQEGVGSRSLRDVCPAPVRRNSVYSSRLGLNPL